MNNSEQILTRIDGCLHVFVNNLFRHFELDAEYVKRRVAPDEAHDVDLTRFDIELLGKLKAFGQTAGLALGSGLTFVWCLPLTSTVAVVAIMESLKNWRFLDQARKGFKVLCPKEEFVEYILKPFDASVAPGLRQWDKDRLGSPDGGTDVSPNRRSGDGDCFP